MVRTKSTGHPSIIEQHLQLSTAAQDIRRLCSVCGSAVKMRNAPLQISFGAQELECCHLACFTPKPYIRYTSPYIRFRDFPLAKRLCITNHNAAFEKRFGGSSKAFRKRLHYSGLGRLRALLEVFKYLDLLEDGVALSQVNSEFYEASWSAELWGSYSNWEHRGKMEYIAWFRSHCEECEEAVTGKKAIQLVNPESKRPICRKCANERYVPARGTGAGPFIYFRRCKLGVRFRWYL